MTNIAPYVMTSPQKGAIEHGKIFVREDAVSLEHGFSFSYLSESSTDDLSEKCHCDLMHPLHMEKLTGARRIQKSLDSKEFEFDMPTIVPHVLDEPEQAASADELFYKGRLLPLQYDSRRQLVQTLSSRATRYRQNSREKSWSGFSCPPPEDEMKHSSWKIDGTGVENVLIDSGSSSFRSQSSSLWEKEARDSSPSRDSNGSSQDSCCSGAKEISTNIATSMLQPENSQCGKALGQSGKRSAFSWKTIVCNLKTAPKVWVDDQVEDQKPRTGTKMDWDGNREQQLFPFNFRASELSKGVSMTSSAKVSSVSTSSHKWVGPIERETDRTSWHSKERWKRYVKKLKPLYVKMTKKLEEMNIFGQLRMEDCGKASIVNRTISFTKSTLQGKHSQSVLYGNADCACSARYLTVTICPASMRSSPNHSGVLAVIEKATSASAMQELQSAIQSAIAHCKQSQAGKK